MKKILFIFLTTTFALLNATIFAPTALTLEPTTNSVTLSWHENSDTEIGFKIFRDGKLISTVAPNITTFTDHNLQPNTTYRYEVKATDGYDVTRYPEDENTLQDGYAVYYPENDMSVDMPVVVFLEGGGYEPKIDMYSGIMRLLAARGYFVIGLESGASYDSSYAASIADKAISVAKHYHNLTLKKIAVMGHSQGGGQAFYVMKHLQDSGYGKDGSLTLSIDGWFAFNMYKADLGALKGDVSFIQMNNLIGTGTDPRIHLSIWNLAKSTHKTFFTLPYNDHFYIKGSQDEMLEKTDILQIVNSLCDDTFLSGRNGYKAIPDERKASYTQMYNALKAKDYYSADCAGVMYNAQEHMSDYDNDIDYCKPELY